MASKGKKKTTMAKLARESRLRERQQDKKAKKDARKRAGEQPLVEMAEFDEGTEETAVVPEQAKALWRPWLRRWTIDAAPLAGCDQTE